MEKVSINQELQKMFLFKVNDKTNFKIKDMEMFAKHISNISIDLCAKNAEIFYNDYWNKHELNEESIINTKEQIL